MMSRCIYREEHDDTHLEIWEEDDRRSLWFDDVILQSEIHIHDPAVLPNPVNRAMLAHLMFELPLERVLLAGCGGGAIARWLHARAPEVAGDAVELSPTVARLAREYFDFPAPASSRWRLQVDDVRAFVARSGAAYDYILVDLEENQSTPDWVTGEAFLTASHRRLSPTGVLTLNLIVDDNLGASSALQRIRRVFGPGILLVDDPAHDNLLVLAFRAAAPAPPPADRLRRLGQTWGIDFSALAGRVTRLPAADDAPR
ncbi:MAG: methyltransferase [Gammaproteobacteria bacterium]|nr:methyltransferase [Gammaproteobacteria bacterium]